MTSKTIRDKFCWDMALLAIHNSVSDEKEKFFYSSMWWGLNGMHEPEES